jgi:hypothetical protein
MRALDGLNGMSSAIAGLAAEAEKTASFIPETGLEGNRRKNSDQPQSLLQSLPVHSFPATFPGAAEKTAGGTNAGPLAAERANPRPDNHAPDNPRPENPGDVEPWLSADEFHAREQERRTYRGRTVAMLRRYMRYSIETGRLPSVLGGEFFRAKVTSYRVGTFEDRVIFVHDMETCLERLDEFSRELIARHILQEHDRWATAKLLHCNEKTVRRLTPLALDQLSEILLDRGLLERVESMQETRGKNSCQGGQVHESLASDYEQSK